MQDSHGDGALWRKRKPWIIWLLVGVVVVLVIGVALLKKGGYARFEAGTFLTKPMGPERPTDRGIAYQKVMIPSGDRQLSGWWVPADKARATVLVWHGQNEALSHWTYAIKRFHDSGLSVMVFDYTGFGDSPGKPSVENLRQDSAAAVKAFDERSSKLPRYLLGYSMGAGVMLDYLREYPAVNHGVVVVSGWSSIREVAMATGGLPKTLSWMVPDAYDNAKALRAVTAPVLIVHSRTDGRFPALMAESNVAANSGARLVMTDTPAHSDFLVDPQVLQGKADQLWDAVLQFMR